MTKQEFLARLAAKLPKSEREEQLAFYSEMIDDRIEDGLSEEQAVLAVGTAKEIIAQTVAEIPLAKIAKERIKSNRRLKAWEIVLLAFGSPIWLSLGIALMIIFFIDNPFHGLIISQMILSVQLPFTVFLQVGLTSSKKVMGKYVNSRWSTFLLYTIAAIVSILNIMLLFS